MSSIFSVQNLQTFFRRKNLRPPSRGGPPGPRPPPPPPNRGRSPLGRSPLGRGLSLGADCSGAFVSSAIILLLSQWPLIGAGSFFRVRPSPELRALRALPPPLLAPEPRAAR